MNDVPIVIAPQRSESELIRLLQEYPLPLRPNNKNETNHDNAQQEPQYYEFAYGTAGFRYDATILESTMVRVGILAAIRSHVMMKKQQEEQQQHDTHDTRTISEPKSLSCPSVGIMVTASHNDESYNGVKLSDPHGGMMAPDGEVLAVQLANAKTVDHVMALVRSIMSSGDHHDNHHHDTVPPPRVHVGMDTRCHSSRLTQLAIRAASAMGATVYMHGVITTPILHYCVMMDNPSYNHLPTTMMIPGEPAPSPAPRFPPNVIGYYDQLVHSYFGFLSTIPTTAITDFVSEPLFVDCACGVGYAHVQRLNETLQRFAASTTVTNPRRLIPFNAPQDGPLNEHCGSEHVQKQQLPPTWYTSTTSTTDTTPINITYAASIDGDADRIVFFSNTTKHSTNDDSLETNTSSSTFTLLDGDKIAVLLCAFIVEQVSILEKAISSLVLPSQQKEQDQNMSIKVGVVQTAYANGASTLYVKQLFASTSSKDDNNNNTSTECVVIAKTGVKYVHEAAHTHFDVGIYFEANGHGTIVLGSKFYDFLAYCYTHIRADGHDEDNSHLQSALQRLSYLPTLVNQAVGDALSDLLLVDAILQYKQWTIQDWSRNLYTDLPSRQSKIKVQDRTMIVTNDNETRCIQPPELQLELDALVVTSTTTAVTNNNVRRVFVRPSGTENVVRVYAEASTQDEADELAMQAGAIVYRLCHGVGDLPVISKL